MQPVSVQQPGFLEQGIAMTATLLLEGYIQECVVLQRKQICNSSKLQQLSFKACCVQLAPERPGNVSMALLASLLISPIVRTKQNTADAGLCFCVSIEQTTPLTYSAK